MLVDTDIAELIARSGVGSYTGQYTSLGSGEMNESFRVELESGPVVLRIEKHPEQYALQNEARALELLSGKHGVPKLLYFDASKLYTERLWIIEEFVSGEMISRPNEEQYQSLGETLAYVHAIAMPQKVECKRTWEQFLEACSNFGDESYLINHSDDHIRAYVAEAHVLFQHFDQVFNFVRPSLIHGDATPSNLLVAGNTVHLIDWELSKWMDPMGEFATIYYDDMEYNKGKWRVQITDAEKQALFKGYHDGGGEIDEERIEFWMWFDKLGAAIYLYWRMHEAKEKPTEPALQQYQHDLENLLTSLQTKPLF